MTKSGKKEIKGAEAIYEYLTRLNKKVRESEKVWSTKLSQYGASLTGQAPP